MADTVTDDVLAVLQPMWHEKAETARRIRGRIDLLVTDVGLRGV